MPDLWRRQARRGAHGAGRQGRRQGRGGDRENLHHRRPRDRHPRRRDDLPRRGPARHQAAASVLLAEARLPAGRQLPRLHGRDRGRARAGGKLHPHAVAGHEGQDPDRPRQDRAQDGRRAVGHRSAGNRDRARSGFRALEDRDTAEGRSRPLPEAEAVRSADSRTAATWRWRSISTPASNAISASAPAAKCRSTTSSAWPAAATAKRSCSTSTIRWAPRPASPAANACRPARPAR